MAVADFGHIARGESGCVGRSGILLRLEPRTYDGEGGSLGLATGTEPVLVAWSGGKDSALALREVLGDPRYRVAALLTTVTAEYDRISMHGGRRTLLRPQAESLGLPPGGRPLPPGASHDAQRT